MIIVMFWSLPCDKNVRRNFGGTLRHKSRKNDPRVIPECYQSGPRVVSEWSQWGPNVIRVIMVIRVMSPKCAQDENHRKNQ